MTVEAVVGHLKAVIIHEIGCEEEIAKLLEEGAHYYEDDLSYLGLISEVEKARERAKALNGVLVYLNSI